LLKNKQRGAEALANRKQKGPDPCGAGPVFQTA
jgi:hypothetical protein